MATALYRIYDAKTRLLYVGISEDPAVRLRTHKTSAGWSYLARSWSCEWFTTRGLAMSAEFRAVEGEGPLFNGDFADCFQGSAIDARAAIPANLEREPLYWSRPNQGRAPIPSRLLYWEFGSQVVNLSLRRAHALAKRITHENPESGALLAAERAGVPQPWGAHALIGFAVRRGLISLDATA
ncbi:GIY-YIG nuclease family protein [Streptomyces nigrescens]